MEIRALLISLPGFILSLISSFTWLTPPGPYRATICPGRKLISGSHTYSLTTQGHGGPPRMRDELNAGATSKTAQTRKMKHTRHTLIHSKRPIWNDDYGGKMIFGDRVGLSFLTFVLQVRRNPEKTSPRKPPTGDRTRARCVTSAHATTCSTAVDYIYILVLLTVPDDC